MTVKQETHYADVIVAGAGPAGLTAAGDLARCGRSVAVLERWPQINQASRAFATMARTLEVLDARGLADGLLSHGHASPGIRLFAGAGLDLSRLPSRYPFVLVTPQVNVDQALARYAAEQGADVHRGLEVVSITQDADGVTVTARPRDDEGPGHRSTWRARYLIGADGAHSTVRRLLGAGFPGQTVLSSVVLADVRLTAGPAGGGLTLGTVPDALGFLVPYGDRAWFRSMTWDRRHQVPDSAPVRVTEIADVLNRAMGRDMGVAEVSWHSRFHCEERQVPQYRTGRVFLAGDAAHVHSPVGGQGMNTGIQDAANLAWKLDAVLGGAPDRVLDTYQAERHPVGRQVLRQSGLLMRAVILHPRAARWLRDRLAPPLLALGPVRDAVAGRFAGTGLRYPRTRGESPLTGTRATEVPLAGGRLTEVQRAGGFVLVHEKGGTLPAPGRAGLIQTRRTDDGPALLVRPDGYIAWAGPSAGPGEPWRPALEQWTGPLGTPAPQRRPAART